MIVKRDSGERGPCPGGGGGRGGTGPIFRYRGAAEGLRP